MSQTPTPVVCIALLAVASCSPTSGEAYVSETEYGAEWPLTVPDGRLRCDEPGVVTFQHGEVVYALNGSARALGYPEIGPIWRDAPEPDPAGPKVSIRPLVDRGLALCQR